jgi:hypothetical protein
MGGVTEEDIQFSEGGKKIKEKGMENVDKGERKGNAEQ